MSGRKATVLNKVYIRLAGVEGESVHHAHPKWIDADSWNWGIEQPLAWVSKAQRKQSAAYPVPQRIKFHKPPDAASAVLLQKCAEGIYLPDGTLEVWGANTSATKALIKLDFKDIFVVSVTVGTGQDGQLADEIEIAYGIIKWEHQTLGGAAASGGWDFETHKKPS